MPTLIHLNGPSGVGKSTLARRYVDDHPGVLDLDIDTVVRLIGGWRDDFFRLVAPARRIAIAMAETHLSTGQDVVMPQLVTRLSEAGRFEEAAADAGAAYVEIALTAGRREQIERFRSKAPSDINDTVERAVDSEGGDALLERIHQDFLDYISERPHAVHVTSAGLDTDQTYDEVLAAVNRLRR